MTRNHNNVQSLRIKWCTCLLVPCIVFLMQGSIARGSMSQGQTIFEADPSQKIAHAVPLPDSVLQILSKDGDVVACMKDYPISREGSLASWFSASEIHLNGPNETDLVVLPVVQGDRYMCFHSVEGIGWFWVFRQNGAHARYQLILKTAGLDLIVRDTRHNGYRDIQSEGQVGKFGTRGKFRFENGFYREYR